MEMDGEEVARWAMRLGKITLGFSLITLIGSETYYIHCFQ